ncbi:hypothetical protein ABEB36_001241 [Hypothenemus hampei]|uniref:Uncharacterized protein n=1 Tax=Hypothenemus hampei TaxID=57062 RepID=A0ABD1FGH1_HYPHA
MWFLLFLVVPASGNDLIQECAKYYRPSNYMDVLSKFNLPYLGHVTLPNNQQQYLKNRPQTDISPSPVLTTKVLAVKTKYVYKSPFCVKYTKKQQLCQSENAGKIVTKHNFSKKQVEERIEGVLDVLEDEKKEEIEEEPDRFSLKISFDKLEPSEFTDESRAFGSKLHTPSMTSHKVQELLIEDRLDQLETILPEYRRRRTYETSTIYVTKTLTDKRAMATLVVKNCVPLGYDVCPKKTSNRRTHKLAKKPQVSKESLFYFG